MIDVTEEISAARPEAGGRYQLAGNAGGTVTRCDPPHGFDATWETGGDGPIGLYLHLTTRQAVDPAKVADWSASEEGRRFLTASSDAWHEASVAFGTDPAAARAAADRITAFYTGAPNPA